MVHNTQCYHYVMKVAVACNYLHNTYKITGFLLLICIMSHQAKLIEVCKHSPGVNISQAVPHLQVCQGSEKHLKATKGVRRNGLRLSAGIALNS